MNEKTPPTMTRNFTLKSIIGEITSGQANIYELAFIGWDEIESELVERFKPYKPRFDIAGWRFINAKFWHNELYDIPPGCRIQIIVFLYVGNPGSQERETDHDLPMPALPKKYKYCNSGSPVN